MRNKNEKNTVTAPCIHLNGSGKENLLDQWKAFYRACDAALEAAPAPHMRDFYPLPNGTEVFQAAMDEHRERVVILNKLIDDAKAVARTIQHYGRM